MSSQDSEEWRVVTVCGHRFAIQVAVRLAAVAHLAGPHPSTAVAHGHLKRHVVTFCAEVATLILDHPQPAAGSATR